MSPTLLSKRLKELESVGIVQRARGKGGGWDYVLTAAGRDLKPIILNLGVWGQRWVEARTTLKNLDPSLLMWDMRRNLDPMPMSPRRAVIQIVYPELVPARRTWWLVVEGREIDLCSFDPGFEVDLCIETDLRTMTAIWMGLSSVGAEVAAGRFTMEGDRKLKASIQQWLGLSPFAVEKKLAAA
jgi:hypothetical protein